MNKLSLRWRTEAQIHYSKSMYCFHRVNTETFDKLRAGAVYARELRICEMTHSRTEDCAAFIPLDGGAASMMSDAGGERVRIMTDYGNTGQDPGSVQSRAPSSMTAIQLFRARLALNPYQKIYDAQKTYFATGVTRGYEWRVEQLDRMATLLSENVGVAPIGVQHYRTALARCASPRPKEKFSPGAS